jgi:NAD(P)H-dependent FMN reductase
MRLLAISGSLRAASTNTAVLEALSRVAPAGVEIVIYRQMGALPHFNPDDDGVAPPPAVISLRKLVGCSRGLIIATPEYAHGVPGALKNALDWLVASLEFPDKPVALINAAPRAHHAQAALREILITMSARLISEAFVLPPLTGQDGDADRIVADSALAQALRAGLDRVVEAMRGDAA